MFCRPNQRLAGLLSCVMLALAPNLAMADVIEIDHGEAIWKSGGRALSLVAASRNSSSDYAELRPIDVSSLTEPVVGAGPANWRPHVTHLAAKYDISPALLEALVWQESRWNNNAVSPVGARGLTQLMPGTARDLGVDPRDPLANLEGGARYLRMQLDTFNGDIELALAAYNAGPGRVARLGRIPNIPETRNYVAAIMARLTEPVRR